METVIFPPIQKHYIYIYINIYICIYTDSKNFTNLKFLWQADGHSFPQQGRHTEFVKICLFALFFNQPKPILLLKVTKLPKTNFQNHRSSYSEHTENKISKQKIEIKIRKSIHEVSKCKFKSTVKFWHDHKATITKLNH